MIAVAASAGEGGPKAPAYVEPPFDTDHAAHAVGQLVPYGGTAVVISRDGLVLTAFHAASPCVSRLRRDTATASFFHTDGSYAGEHGPLLCQDLTLALPRPSCESDGRQAAGEPLYLLAVPPVRDATALDQVRLLIGRQPRSKEDPVPRADFALLKLGHSALAHIPVAGRSPVTGESVWVLGYLTAISRKAIENEHSINGFRWEVLEGTIRKALFDALAEAALDPSKGAEAAREFLKRYAPPQDFATYLETYPPKGFLDLKVAAKGPAEALSVIRKLLDRNAEDYEKWAGNPNIVPELAARYNEEAEELRQLAARGQGANVRAVMETLSDLETGRIESEQWDAVGDYSMLSREWCGIPVLFGKVTASNDSTFQSSAFSQGGMSGGPVLNEAGEVLGLAIQGRRSGGTYRPDNAIVARSDVIVRAFGPLLTRTDWGTVASTPTPGIDR